MNVSDLEINLKWLATYYHLQKVGVTRSVLRDVRKSYRYAVTWLAYHGVTDISYQYITSFLILVSCRVRGVPLSVKVGV